MKDDVVVHKRKIHKNEPPSEVLYYINKHTLLHPLLKKIRKALIQNGRRSVTLCGTGAAISRACMLALQIQDMIGGEAVCSLETRTGTVEIVDDLTPNDPDKDYETQTRRNSKIEIILSKK